MFNSILIAVIDFFKTKSPKLYAIFVALVAFVWVLKGQGVVNFPQWLVDSLIALGLVSGAHTTDAKKNL
jgi:hypothetical protein